MKILVIGDVILDRYTYGEVNRASPEDLSIPVLDFSKEEYMLGGAGNVALQIKSLKKNNEVSLAGILDGKACSLVREKNINLFMTYINKPLEKRRFINQYTGKQLLRVDNRKTFESHEIQRFKTYEMARVKKTINNFDLVVLSDYNKGTVDSEVVAALKDFKGKIFIDSKKRDLSFWQDLQDFTIKVNLEEFKNAESLHVPKELIVTEGSKGCIYYQYGSRVEKIKTEKKIPVDVIGAGDCFLAGLAVSYAENQDMIKSLHYANKVATASVTVRGTKEISESFL